MSLLDYSLGDVSFGDTGGGTVQDPSAVSYGQTQGASDAGGGFSWSQAGNFLYGLIDKGSAAYNTIKTSNATTAYGAANSGRPEAYAYNGYANRDLLAPGASGGGSMTPLIIVGGLALAAVLFFAAERK